MLGVTDGGKAEGQGVFGVLNSGMSSDELYIMDRVRILRLYVPVCGSLWLVVDMMRDVAPSKVRTNHQEGARHI